MEYVKLKDLTLSTQYGYTAEETSKTEGIYKYLRITDIVPYFVDIATVPYCTIPQNKVDQYLVHEGDVLIARTGATTGYNYVVPKDVRNTVYASYLIRFNLDKSKILPSYLKYVLKSQSYYGFVNNYIGGSAQPGMNARVFGRFSVPYNSLPVQTRIASILSAYDNLIENNNHRIRLLEQMAENLYKEWFVRFRFPGHEKAEFENGLPKGWKIVKLEKVLDVRYGKDHSKIEDGDIPILGSGGIMRYGNKKLYSSESVLIPRKGSLNNIMYINEPFWTVDTMFYTEMKYKNIAKYMYYVLSGIDMESFNSGAALPSMTTNILNHFKVIIPTEELLRLFDEKISKLFAFKNGLQLQSDLLSRQRDLLLPRLMSGKLEVKC